MSETRTGERTSFDVWNEVPLVPQLTGMSCWAAAAAMIIGWRDVIVVDPEEVAEGAGRWAEYRDGLLPTELEDFAHRWGLTIERQLDWSAEDLRNLLQRSGPVWLGEASPGLHSIVVTGMHGDGSPDATFVRINDPWPIGRGERYTLSWRQLMTNFHAATELAGVHAQLLHAGSRRGGNSGSYSYREAWMTHHSVESIPPSEDVDMAGNGSRHASVLDAGDVAAGSAYIDTTTRANDPLAGHGGAGANLCLIWNTIPAGTSSFDVVVHLHGYSASAPDASMLRAKVAASGISLDRRARPTLAIVPRGRKITADERRASPNANPERYTFPALTRGDGGGLHALVTYAIDHIWQHVLGHDASTGASLDRVILTAHSGGGAALNQLLGFRAKHVVCDPEEVHVFDALYGDPANLIASAKARIAADRALPPNELATRGGGLRIFHGAGTAASSRKVAAALPGPGDPLHDAYRVDATNVGHSDIPRTFGGRLLADVRSDPDTHASAHATSAGVYGAPIGLMESYRDAPPRYTGDDMQPADGVPPDLAAPGTADEYDSVDDEPASMASAADAAVVASPVRARILWPALGFPAVIAPRASGGPSPMADGDATRCICVLLLSNRRNLSKAEAAKYLRYVPWTDRGRRHIAAGATGSFREEELAVRNDEAGPKLAMPGPKDVHCELVAFGGDRDGANGIVVSLASRVREFYRRESGDGIAFLHEIRISEQASNRLRDGQYHLFWNNESTDEHAPSDEMKCLIGRYARPLREKLGDLWAQEGKYLLEEYEYEYGVAHEPYARKLAMRRTRAEVLHPLFVQRRVPANLRIGHLTDTHVHVRADVYEANLDRQRPRPKASFNNWNKDFIRLYGEARHASDAIFLTGDLTDYCRGHWGPVAGDRLGDDDAYHADRNWFLFYYLLAAGESYDRPAYTILGNHDWRLNPYPPFAIAGSPSPRSYFNDYAGLNLERPKGTLGAKERKLIEDQKKVAAEQAALLHLIHGPGDRRAFSYTKQSTGAGELLIEDPSEALKVLGAMALHTQTLDRPGSPAFTTIESVAWYLLSINPFLDYRFTLPSRHDVLMLDWAEDEDVLFPIIQRGREVPYMIWQASEAADPGPKARRCLTDLQKSMVRDFVAARSRAKIIGIHAPPIGPYSDWFDTDLLKGRKIYDNPAEARGPTNYATVKPDGTRERWNGHPLFAVRPQGAGAGMDANYGSFETRSREWFIRALASPAANVRIVLSGHIHRNGLFVVHEPPAPQGSAVSGQLLVRGVIEQATTGAHAPAVTTTPEGRQGPLYINTTSGGPRGHWHPTPGQSYDVDPGWAFIELQNDGTIRRVQFRPVRTARPAGLGIEDPDAYEQEPPYEPPVREDQSVEPQLA